MRRIEAVIESPFWSFASFSSSPASSQVPLQEKQRSTWMPPNDTSFNSIPHLGQRIQCCFLRASRSAAALAFFWSAASLRSRSAFSRAKYSSSVLLGLSLIVEVSDVRLIMLRRQRRWQVPFADE